MKSFLLFSAFLLISLSGYSQGKYFIGLNAGISHTNESALTSSVVGAAFDNKTALIFPAQVGVYRNEKSRIRLDLITFRLKSQLNYSYDAPQPDPAVPSYSQLSIKTETINLNYDYRVASTKKFDFYAAAGLRSLFSTNKKESTTYLDGSKSETESLLADFRRNLFGIGAGALVRYNQTSHIGFTFIPDYAFYFNSFDKENSNKLRRLNLAIGVELRP